MNQRHKADLLPPDEYERQHEAYRQTIIDLKRRRRIGIGDKITMVFENRETLNKNQEMIRVERVLDPQKCRISERLQCPAGSR